MQNQDSIDRYYSYFKNQLDNVLSINDTLVKKILLVVMLDTWARARFPDIKNDNKKRFVAIITKCSNWEEANRVSIPQLYHSLKEIKSYPNNKLSNEVSTRMQSWKHGHILRLDCDPFQSEIVQHAASDEERKMIADSTHAQLLYVYRNLLVHEFREPGYGLEFSNDSSSPYYHGMTSLTGDNNSWELVYPIGFFKNISTDSLNNLKYYFESNDINPYDSYEFGSMWHKK